jgi:hypothetical protein
MQAALRLFVHELRRISPMSHGRFRTTIAVPGLVTLAAILLSGCGGPPLGPIPTRPSATEANPSDLPFVRPYRGESDTCMLTGESPETADYLDDAADLVACPTGSAAAALLVRDIRGREVGVSGDYTLYSVPRR